MLRIPRGYVKIVSGNKTMRNKTVRHGIFSFLAVLVLAFSAGGCVILAAGAVGVVGGYVVSPDTVEGNTARSFEDVWAAAKEIVGIMGHVTGENNAQGVLIAEVNSARVTITIVSINASTTKMSVKARKSFMPKIDLAQDIYTKILNSFDR